MSRYAVAVTMTKNSQQNVMNIVTRLNVWDAVSVEEAKGKAFADAQENNPEHQIFHMAHVMIVEEQDTPQ